MTNKNRMTSRQTASPIHKSKDLIRRSFAQQCKWSPTEQSWWVQGQCHAASHRKDDDLQQCWNNLPGKEAPDPLRRDKPTHIPTTMDAERKIHSLSKWAEKRIPLCANSVWGYVHEHTRKFWSIHHAGNDINLWRRTFREVEMKLRVICQDTLATRRMGFLQASRNVALAPFSRQLFQRSAKNCLPW